MRDFVKLMIAYVLVLTVCVSCLPGMNAARDARKPADSAASIIISLDASPLEQYAAFQLQRGLFQKTGKLYPIKNDCKNCNRGYIVAVAASPRVRKILASREIELPEDGHLILPHRCSEKGLVVLVTGRRGADVLHGVYSLLEKKGGDFFSPVLPSDSDADAREPEGGAYFSPAFAVRGMMPLAGGAESRTAWLAGDYRGYFDRLARMRCNLAFFDLSPEEPFGASPTEQKQAAGSGGDEARGSADSFSYGLSGLYAHQRFTYRRALRTMPRAEATARFRAMFRNSLSYAADRGLDVCLGIEVSGDPGSEAGARSFADRIEFLLKNYPTINYLCIRAPKCDEGAKPKEKRKPGAGLKYLAEKYRKDFPGVSQEELVSKAVPLVLSAALAKNRIRIYAPHIRLVVAAPSEGIAIGLDKILKKEVIIAAHSDLPKSARMWWKIVPGEKNARPLLPAAGIAAIIETTRRAHESAACGAIFSHTRSRSAEFAADAFAHCCWKPSMSVEDFAADFSRRKFGPESGAAIAPVLLEYDSILSEGWSGPAAGGWRVFKDARFRDGLKNVRTKLLSLRSAMNTERRIASIGEVDHLLHGVEWALAFEAASRIMQSQSLEKARAALEKAAGRDEKKKRGLEIIKLLKNCPIQWGLAHCAAKVSCCGELGELELIYRGLVADYRQKLKTAGDAAGIDALAEIDKESADRPAYPFYRAAIQRFEQPAVGWAGEKIDFRVFIPHKGPLSRAELLYRRADSPATEFNRVPLRNIGGYLYSGEFVAADRPGILQYYIVAADARGKGVASPPGAPENNLDAISILPVPPYRVALIPGDMEAAVRSPCILKAAVFSRSGVSPSEVALHFRSPGAERFTRIRMKTDASGLYNATLPAGLMTREGAEYYLEISRAGGESLRCPRKGLIAIRPDYSAPEKINGLAAVRRSGGEVVLEWDVPFDDRGVKGYSIYRMTGASAEWKIIASPILNEYIDAAARPGEKYSYRVEALDCAGNVSGLCEPVDEKPEG